MAEELATIDVEYNGRVYRFNAFASMVMVERQPDGHNVPFPWDSVATTIYDSASQTWDYDGLGVLIDLYEADPDGTNESRPA